MSLIPVDIQSDEVLVRFIFDRNFKRKITEEVNLIIKDLFLPNKGGVSLQRGSYINENSCKLIATSTFEDRVFCGFIIFTKQMFEDVKALYRQGDREEFEAIILSTPINSEGSYIAININRDGIEINPNHNYCHSDLIYLNPAVSREESVNTAIRSFSRKLSKSCFFLKDSGELSDNFQGILFKDAI